VNALARELVHVRGPRTIDGRVQLDAGADDTREVE
jgi:hypothetical protein